MSHQKFQKPAISIAQQLELLQKRGLYIQDKKFASTCLQNVSYYRLSVYCKPYQDQENHFKLGTSFGMIWDLYSFDREFRLIMLDAIERIEIAFRAALSNYMCLHYGCSWYLNSQLFKTNKLSINFYNKLIHNIDDLCRNHTEDFLEHFYSKYADNYPPFWMISECLSFGTISLIYKNLKNMKDKNIIARNFGFHTTIFESWMESLVLTRNICAHHARLWNKWFVFCPKMPSNMYNLRINARHKIYEQILIISLLLKARGVENSWMKMLFTLLDKYDSVPKYTMGFLEQWKKDDIWLLKDKNKAINIFATDKVH